MESKLSITWWIIFYIRYPRLFFKYIKKHREKTVNPSIQTYINKAENRITFEIKTGYYLEIWTPEATKLVGSTKNKITKNENGKNVSNLEITEVVLVHCNIAYNTYQQNSRVLYTLVPNKSFGQLLDISPTNFIFLRPLTQTYHILKNVLLVKILSHKYNL